MMKFLSLLILLSFFLAVSAESSIFNWDWVGSVNNRTVPVHTAEIPTLGAPLMVTSTVGTSLCILRNVQPAKNPLLWKNSCFFFYNFTSDSPVLSKMSRRARRLLIKETSFNPIPGKYYLAISTTEVQTIGFTVALTSVACVHPSSGPGCYQNSTKVVAENATSTFDPGNYFMLDLPEDSSRLEFQVRRVRSADRVVVSLRAGNAPLGNLTNDFSLTISDNEPHTFTIDNPLPSLWYGTVSLPASSALKSLVSGELAPQVSFSYLSASCYNGSGVCPTINTLNNTQVQALVFTTAVGQVTYFKADLEGPAFNFSVQNKDDSSAAPVLLARFEQLPTHSNASTTKDAYDVSSVNNTVNFITLDEYEVGTWYFAVVGNGKSFAVWFNNTCPSTCSSNGHCVERDGVFVCQCNDDYEGFDCTVKTESGFKTEYIVLIVIGSIIALAALLGLLVYLYNRNRHPGGGYEKI